MTSILTGLAEKAKSLWNNGAILDRATKVYDASNNKIVIARMEVDGIVEATISQRTMTEARIGIDPSYYSYDDSDELMTLSINLLPTAKSNALLNSLATRQRKLKGWFYISVYENGDIVDIFRSHIISLPETTLSLTAPDKTYVFGIKSTLNSNIFITPQQTETSTGSVASKQNDIIEDAPVPENTPVQVTPHQPEKGDPNF